jgi:ankyrin repeat protein
MKLREEIMRLGPTLAGAALAPGRPLADAAQAGDLAKVRALLDAGADVNEAQGDGMTALHWAAERGNLEMARMLLARGADVTRVTRIGGYTPLHLASRSGSGPIVFALLRARSDVRATTGTGATALHFAALSGSADAVTALLEGGADVNARDRSAWQQTPLIFAASSNAAAAIRALLQAGADPALAESAVEDIPSRMRVDQEVTRRIRQTLRASRAPTSRQIQEAIRAGREAQRSLEDAEHTYYTDTYGRKMDAIGGQPTLVGSWGGLTALLHAAREGHVEAAIALLDGGANIDQRSVDGTTPLLIAVLNGQFDLALRLVERGADPNLASDAGTTPLLGTVLTQWAPIEGIMPRAHDWQKAQYLDVMKALLEAAADPNARLKQHIWYLHSYDLRVDLQGATAFWRAAYAADVQALRLLAAHGADPNLPIVESGFDRGGDGALQLTGMDGGARAVADPSGLFAVREDPTGLPPVPVGGPSAYPIHAASGLNFGVGHRAEAAHRHVPDGWLSSVTFLLEEMHVDVNARDANGYTPLHHAASTGDLALVRYLVSKGADVTALARTGESVADMANGPLPRGVVYPEVVKLLESLGSVNHRWCMAGASPGTCIRT